MQRDPYPTVLEYLRSPEPQMRRNAVIALAVLGRRTSARKLVETALDDPDPGVRQRAETELVEMDDREDYAAHALEEFLRTPSLRNGAYALAGRLHRRGWRGRPRPGPPHARIAAANGLRAQLYPERDLRFRTRAVSPAFISAILGSLVMGWMMLLLGMTAAPELAYTGFLFAAVLAMVASQRAVPLALHYDPAAAVAAEVGWAAALALFPGFLVVLPALWVASGDDGGPVLSVGVIGVPLLVAIVRAATLAAGGAWDGPVGRWVATASGTGAGWLAATALYAVWGGRGGSPAVGGMWLLCLLLSITLATVYASIDYRGEPRRPVLRYASRALAVALAGVVAVPVVLLMLPRYSHPVAARSVVRVPVPAVLDLKLVRPTWLGVAALSVPPEIAGADDPPHEHQLSVFDDFGPPVAQGLVAAAKLRRGNYQVTVHRVRDDPAAAVFERLAQPLAPLLRIARAPADSVYLELALLPDSASLAEYKIDRSYSHSLAYVAQYYIRQRDPDMAFRALEQLRTARPAAITPSDWNMLCWQGTLSGGYQKASVRAACARAVGDERNPGAAYQGGRGLNRLLRGDTARARQDLSAYLQTPIDPALADTLAILLRDLGRGAAPLPQSRREYLLNSTYLPITPIYDDTVMAPIYTDTTGM